MLTSLYENRGGPAYRTTEAPLMGHCRPRLWTVHSRGIGPVYGTSEAPFMGRA